MRQPSSASGRIGGDDPETGGRPEDQGFDHFYGYLNSVHAHNYWPTYLWRNREKVQLRNVVKERPPGYAGFIGGMATKKVDYAHDLIMNESLDWVREHKDDPFFLFLTPTIPHANPEARKFTGNGTEVPDLGIYADRDWREQNKGQAAMITRLDTGVGQLIDLLRELKIDRKTLVIFTSDNGPHGEAGHDSEFFDANGPLRGQKFSLWEGGVRVPAIAWWPGAIAGGGTSDHVCYLGDIMSTSCELAGVAAPSPPHGLDSVSLVPTLTGQGDQPQHPYLYFEQYGWESKQAIRLGKWKAIRTPLGFGDTLLFDLEKDLAEQHNVADEHPDVRRNAERLMDEAHVDSEHWKAPPKPSDSTNSD